MKPILRILTLALSLSLLLSSVSCGSGGGDPAASDSESSTTTGENSIVLAAKDDKESTFSLAYNVDLPSYETAQILRMRTVIYEKYGIMLPIVDDYFPDDEENCEIIIASEKRAESASVMESLSENEYAIKTVVNGEKIKIVIAYKGLLAQISAIDRFCSEFLTDDKISVPVGLDIRGTCEENIMITSSIANLRDPSILYENGTYYAYGTGWVCYKNTSGSLSGEWQSLGMVVQTPAHATTNYWAPEVHKYNGAYYMFTTYFSDVTNHRGCTVLKSDSPEGPFVEISDGHVTPSDWDAIDGTLYVDEDGQPWMIFVHEWTSTDDGIGRMAAAKLSDDLSRFISEPIELFRADDAPWATAQVTDGCYLYRCENGELIMIWSNFGTDGYRIGIARSDSGKVDGKWKQDKAPLYSKEIAKSYFGVDLDGGHGMLFNDKNGQLYLSFHSPNSPVGDRKEKPVFIPLRELNGTLVFDPKES